MRIFSVYCCYIPYEVLVCGYQSLIERKIYRKTDTDVSVKRIVFASNDTCVLRYMELSTHKKRVRVVHVSHVTA